MTEQTTQATADETTCRYPGCCEPPAKSQGPGRPSGFCSNPAHTKASAFKERQRLKKLSAEATGEPVTEDTGRPVTLSERRTRDLLPTVQSLAVQLQEQFGQIAEQLSTLSDPGAAAAQIETVQTEAAEKIAHAAAEKAKAMARADEAEAEKEEAEAAANEAIAQAQQDHDAAEQARGEAATFRAELEELREDTTVRITAIEATATRRIEQAQATTEQETARIQAEAAEQIRQAREAAQQHADEQIAEAREKARQAEDQAQEKLDQAKAIERGAEQALATMRQKLTDAEAAKAIAEQRAEQLQDDHERIARERTEERERWAEDLNAARTLGKNETKRADDTATREANALRRETTALELVEQLRTQLAELANTEKQPTKATTE